MLCPPSEELWEFDAAAGAEEIIDRLAARDFGPDGGPLAVQAWRAWSEAIRDYVPTNEDQYGPFLVSEGLRGL